MDGDIGPAPAPPAARPPAAPEPAEPCHPAYHPCLPDLPGDALDCADLAADLKPVVVRDPAVDPYRLATGTRRRACDPAAPAAGASPWPANPGRPPPPAPPPTAAPLRSPGDGAQPRATGSATTAPPPAAEPEPPEVENVAAVCAPGTEPAGGSQPGDLATPPGVDSAQDAPPPDPATAPPAAGVAPTDPSEPGSPEAPQAGAGDVWCLPEITGDTVRLFWCEDDPAASPDLEVHGDGYGDGAAPVYHTRPLTLAAGTRIERYSTCTGLNATEEVVGFVELPDGAYGEPALGVQLCGRFFLGEELYSWGLGLYRARQDPDGRYRIEMPEPVEYLGTC